MQTLPMLIRVEHRWFKARGLASARLRWPAAIRRRWTSGLCSVAAGGPRTRDRLIVAQVMPMDDGPGSFLMIFFLPPEVLEQSNLSVRAPLLQVLSGISDHDSRRCEVEASRWSTRLLTKLGDHRPQGDATTIYGTSFRELSDDYSSSDQA